MPGETWNPRKETLIDKGEGEGGDHAPFEGDQRRLREETEWACTLSDQEMKVGQKSGKRPRKGKKKEVRERRIKKLHTPRRAFI